MKLKEEIITWMAWPECEKQIEANLTYLIHIRAKGCEGLPTYIEKAYYNRKFETWQKHQTGESINSETVKWVAEMPKELQPNER